MEDAVFVILMLVYLVVSVVMWAGMWKVYAKAGKPGWATLVPIYNMVVWMQIVRRPILWVLLMLVPCVGALVSVVLVSDLAKAFGKGVGFTLGLIFLPMIFLPILGFGDAVYQRPVYRGGGPKE